MIAIEHIHTNGRLLHRIAVLFSLVLGLAAWSGSSSAMSRRPLNPADPPAVIRLNHQYNLELLQASLERTLQEIDASRSAALRACANDVCRRSVWRDYHQRSAFERERSELAVEEETLTADEALEGAQDRLRAEEQRRVNEAREQAERHRELADHLREQRLQERKDNIRRHASHTDQQDQMLVAGERAVTPTQGNPYGDVSSRFRARRRTTPSREWRDPAEGVEHHVRVGAAPDANGSAGECVAAADRRECRRAAILNRITRLEGFLSRLGPSAVLEQKISRLRSDLQDLDQDQPVGREDTVERRSQP